MKNELANNPSSYLQQHKNNPVHWQVWSKKVLELAKKEKKPILLSVGYASCHWCHVMAHESFEDIETADLMNKYFINIKVDREERPDLDFVFQSSFQLFNQTSGGWPLTMFLDENAVPFMGGTYFPKISTNGLPAFKEVLEKVGNIYVEQKEKIKNQSHVIKTNLELRKNSVLNQDLEPIMNLVLDNLDGINGGYKGAPKFPMFNIFESFLYFYNKTKNEKYLNPVALILKKICSQGIYDHVEGGVSRYTVDENWLIPHFEKMLYDNAQLVSILSKYYKIEKSDYFKKKIIQTILYISKNFANNENGLLGSSYDADSEGQEGKYYVFKYEEIKNIQNISNYFDVKPEGNWEGNIILREINIPDEKIIVKLKKLRALKTKPFFDSKIQLDLNCLWISALTQAHSSFPSEGYLDHAEKLFEKLDSVLIKDDLRHCNIKSLVFLEDYAYLINCLLDLYDQTLIQKYRIKAQKFCEEVVNKFYIKEKNIFQKNQINYNDIFLSPIDISDHTIPNGNAIMLTNFTRLGLMQEAEILSKSLNGYLNIYKSFMLSSVRAIDHFNEISSGKKCNENGCSI